MGPKPSWPHDETVHAWWVEPDRLLAGEYPGSLDESTARRKIRCLVAAGIDSFLDLTEDGVMQPYAELLAEEAEAIGKPGPSHHRFAIPDVDIVSETEYDKIVSHIRDEIDAGKRMYVHCWGGKGRTGTVIGCWLIDNDGLGYQATLERLQALREGTKKAREPVPETSGQRNVLRQRAARDPVG